MTGTLLSMCTLLLLAASVASLGHATSEPAPGITLDVAYIPGSDNNSRLLNIKCNVDSRRTNLAMIAAITVFGSRPYGGQDQFDKLAIVDMWSNNPRVTGELSDADVSVSGAISQAVDVLSTLSVAWNSPTNLYRHTYRCVAHGIDVQGQAVSVSTSSRLETVTGGCCQDTESIMAELHAVAALAAASVNTSVEISQQVEALTVQVDRIEAKIDAIAYSTRHHVTLLHTDRSRFDVSRIWRDRVYLISKMAANFDIMAANNACRNSGGHLLEIETDEETQFVTEFARQVGGDHFALGGTDTAVEGTFVYYHSGQAVPANVTWRAGEPNNSRNNEDCMEIWISRGGLNDIRCDMNVKFVCEVPLHPSPLSPPLAP